ncbi:MAG TPA: glycosyltransferase family 4 protein [Gemmataceae bacterium]|nr:glycosyltransferase family 4 protein [Gemmataceae bacterium]
MPRILYFNHDNPNPSGGVRTIYTHVRHLVRNGLPAFVVHGYPQISPRWFNEDVPRLYLQSGLKVKPDDVVIIPEDLSSALESLKSIPAKKVVFCQNHFGIFAGLGQHPSWQELGIHKVFCCSDVVADFLRTNLGWQDVPVVHCAIDHSLFRPASKLLQIACMPHKRRLEADFVLKLTHRLLGNPADIGWAWLDGASEKDVARVLAESAIYLSMSHLEGLGLPPLEAMASGCVVVGFHGYGGLEYATPQNGLWCEEGNPVACAHMLKRAVDLVRQRSHEMQQLVDNGLRTASCYTLQRQEQELLRFMRTMLDSG